MSRENQQPEIQTNQYDVDGGKRQAALTGLHTVLRRASEASTFNQADQKQAYEFLEEFCTESDKLVSAMLHDIQVLLEAVVRNEVSVFALRTNVKTIAHALQENNVVTIDQMRKIHDEVIVPEEVRRAGGAEAVSQISQDK